MLGEGFHFSVRAHQQACESGSYASDLIRRSLHLSVHLANMELCDSRFITSSQPSNLYESKNNYTKLKKPKSGLNKKIPENHDKR